MGEEKTKKRNLIKAGIVALIAAIILGVVHFAMTGSGVEGKKMQGYSADPSPSGDIDKLFNTRSCRNGNFSGVDFTKYKSNNFVEVSAPNSDFSGANISSVNFNLSTLNNCDFTSAVMGSTSFQRVNLDNGVMDSASMTNINAPNAQMNNVNFSNATISGCNFMNSQLDRATFSGATITGGSFSAADFSGAKLADATIDSATIFTNATYDSSTTFPSGFDPEKRGMKKK